MLQRFVKSLRLGLLCAAITIAVAPVTYAQETPAAPAAAPAAPAPAAAATPAAPDPAAAAPYTNADATLLNDVSQYFNNLAPGTAGGPKTLAGVPGPGHNGWMMTCSALVLFMTLPGLALFYGGLVRKKNVLSVLAQCLGCATLVPILWWAVGYSLVFDTTGNAYLGGFGKVMLKTVTSAPNTTYAGWVSENVFCMFQMMFAIITPGLIVGAIAERMKFSAIMTFIGGWMFLVYFPLAHMVWGGNGLMNGVWNADAAIPAIDFAGGTVVHMSSGWSALVLCIILGPRIGFGKENMSPHSMVLCMVGTGMLWVGWYGFNAGSAVAADVVSASAFISTTLAAAVGGFTWAFLEFVIKGKASILGFCSGIVAGLVVITPAAGFVTPNGAMIIGVLSGVVPFIAVTKLKPMIGYDDALDTFGVHAVGGTLGAIITGVLADASVNANLINGAVTGKNGLATAAANNTFVINGGKLLTAQLTAAGITIVLSVVMTIVLAMVIKYTLGLRPTPEGEREGLDTTDHGEEGYIM